MNHHQCDCTDMPPSLCQHLLSKLQGNDSESVSETPGESLQCKLFFADSPCNDDKLRSKSEGTSDISVVTSHKSAEMSAADEVRSGLSRVSVQPLAAVLPCSNSDPVNTITITSVSASSDNLKVHAAEETSVSSNSSPSVARTEFHLNMAQ